MVDGAMATAPRTSSTHGFSILARNTNGRMVNMSIIGRHKTYEELQEQMQKVINNVAEQLKRDAVSTLVTKDEHVRHCSITIDLDFRMIPTITYSKESYVTPITALMDYEMERQ